MIHIVYYIFFAVSFYLVYKKKGDFIYFVPLFNVIADTSFSYFVGFSAPTYLRAAILTYFLYIAYPYFRGKSIARPFYWFFLYVGLMTLMSSEMAYSIKGSFQAILSMSFFLVGYGLVNNYKRYEKLMRALFWVILFSVIVTALGYLFGIGKDLEYTLDKSYDGAPESVGLLGSGGLYTPAMLLALYPILSKLNFGLLKRWVLYGSMFLLYIFVLLNVRRTAISIPIIGLMGFLLYSNFRRKILQYMLFGGVLLVVTFPLYGGYFMRRFDLRESKGRFTENFYKTEERYRENVDLTESITTFKEPLKVLFGFGNNIFAEAAENGHLVRRMYHSDTAKLFYGVGLFGIALYFSVFIRLFYEIIKIPSRGILISLKSAAMGLFLILLLVSINGSILLITFRAVTLLLLGSFMGFAKTIIKTDGRVLLEG